MTTSGLAAAPTGTALDDYLDEQLANGKVPGIGVGVLHEDRTYVAVRGVTSVVDPLPVDEDTLFMIGSITKTMTAIALMSFVDAGRLHLDDLVATHLPELKLADPHVRDTVTVGQLLNHTAGWTGDVLVGTTWGDDALRRVLSDVIPALPQQSAPGQVVSYSNSAFFIAGRLLEVLSGQTYEDAVRRQVFDPLEMTSSYFLPWEVASRRTAVGHSLTDGVPQVFLDWPLSRGMHPAGGVLSSLRDQLVYARYCLRGDAARPPLRETTRLAMQQPTARLNSVLTGVGISWLLEDRNGLELVTHTGNVSNLQVSSLVMAPSREFAIVVLTNSRAGTGLSARLTDWAIEHFLGESPRQALTALTVEETDLQEYVGRYDSGQWCLDVSRDGDTLSISLVLPQVEEGQEGLLDVPPVEVCVVGPDQLAATASPTEVAGDFLRDATGRVCSLRWGLRVSPKLA